MSKTQTSIRGEPKETQRIYRKQVETLLRGRPIMSDNQFQPKPGTQSTPQTRADIRIQQPALAPQFSPEPPQPPVPQVEQDTATPPRKRRLISILAGFLTGILVGAAGGVGYMLWDQRSDNTADEESDFTLTVHGSVQVPGRDASGSPYITSGGRCRANDGYDDVREGGQVIIRDSANTVIGLGYLNGGRIEKSDYVDGAYETGKCIFTFEIEEVNPPSGFVSIDVGNRAPYTIESLALWDPIDLTLGY